MIKTNSKKAVRNSQFAVREEKYFRSVCFFVIVILLSISKPSFADTYLESVLKDGFGVRPIGMGGAFTAVADDSDAIFYNPAGLSDAKAQYTRGYLDMNTDSYDVNDCYAVATSQAGFANWNRWDKTGQKVSVTGFSFGTKGNNKVSWGVTFKNIAWSLAGGDDKGWTLDAGIKAPLMAEINVGVLFQDLVKNTAPVSSTVRLGAAMNPAASKDSILAVDAEFRDLKSEKGATIYMHYGAEFKLTNGLIVRGGWTKDRYSAGATATFPYVTLDYAVIINPDSKNTQMFGFRIGEDSGRM
ncbi:MAG: hypothetical protein NTZ10_04465 [Candidatus Saganbacteria bacterium]|nr:hypothetical protein [Candidatus Saganbacteria bacterium]